MNLSRAALAVVAASALTMLVACADDPDPNDGHIYVTQMHGGGCEYDDERAGIVFSFDVTGHKDTDLVAEVHQSAPGAGRHRPGPVIASAVHEIRHGNYENPITIVVPLKKSRYDAERAECILQTEHYGPDIMRKDRQTKAP